MNSEAVLKAPRPPPTATVSFTDNLLYKTSSSCQITGSLSTTVTNTSTSLVHTDARALRALLLSSSLPPLFLPQKSSSHPAFHATPSPCSSLLSFIHPVETSRTRSGRASKKRAEYVLLLEDESTSDSDPESTVDEFADERASSIVISFRTISHDEARQKVSFYKSTGLPNSPHPIEVSLTGTITLCPDHNGATQVTASASIETGKATVKEAGSEELDLTGTATFSKIKTGDLVLGADSALELPYTSLGGSLVDHLLSVVARIHAKFARYDDLDEAAYLHFVKVTVPSAPPLKLFETTLLNKTTKIDSYTTESTIELETTAAPARAFRRIKNTVNQPVELFVKKLSGEAAAGKGVVVIDVSAIRIAAWLMCYTSYDRLQQHMSKHGTLMRQELDVPGSRSKIMFGVNKFPGTLDNRLFSILWTWKVSETDGSITVAFGDIRDYLHGSALELANKVIANNTHAVKATRGSTRGFWRLVPLAENVCRVSLVQQSFAGGSIPDWVIDFKLRDSLATVIRLHDQFERNVKVVDSETRKAFPTPPLLEELTAEQKGVVAECIAVETGGNEGAPWSLVVSRSSLVKMWKKHNSAKRGGRDIALGRAVGTIDCSAKEALAWSFDYCSRERMQINFDEDNPARVVAEVTSPHDNVIATVKRMPFPLRHREFVLRQLSLRDNETLDFLHVALSVDVWVDYGCSMKTVRGTAKVVTRFTPLEETQQCKVTITQYLDAAGNIPVAVANSKIPESLGSVISMRNAFQRDDEFDAADRTSLAQVIRERPQTYSAEEAAIFERIRGKLGSLSEPDFKDLESPDPLVIMKSIFIKGDSIMVLRGSSIIDTTAEECAAFDLLKMSRENLKSAQNLKRAVVEEPNSDHSFIFHFVKDFRVPGFQPREWLLRVLWKKLESDDADTVITCYESIPEHPDFPFDPTLCTRASNTVLNVYEKLPPLGGIPQTRATWTQRVDMAGAIPKWFTERQGSNQLMHLSRMRSRFDKTLNVIEADRVRISGMILRHSSRYSDEENRIIGEGFEHFELLVRGKAKRLKMVSPQTSAKIAFVPGDRRAWGWASTVVRASPVVVLAHSWDTLGRDKLSADDLEKTIEEAPNDHNQLVYARKKTPKVIDTRDFLGRVIWKKTATGYVWVGKPEENAVLRPRVPGVVRAMYPTAMKIDRFGSSWSKIEYVIHPDSGGVLPAWLMNFYIKKNLAKVTEVREHFQSLRELGQWTEEDAETVGETFVTQAEIEKHVRKGEKKVDVRVRDIFRRYKGLRQAAAKYEFLEGLMTRVVRNQLRPPSTVSAKLCNLTLKNGSTIGRGLAASLATNLTAEAAVDEWIGKYRALQELDRAEIWFRPMVEAVACRLLSEVPWGMKMRVFIGAFLSIVDMASDINVIIYYFVAAQNSYAWGLVGMIVASLSVQLLMVYVQHKMKPMRLLKEIVIVLTGLKPGKRN
jgi:hypothetical protein